MSDGSAFERLLTERLRVLAGWAPTEPSRALPDIDRPNQRQATQRHIAIAVVAAAAALFGGWSVIDRSASTDPVRTADNIVVTRPDDGSTSLPDEPTPPLARPSADRAFDPGPLVPRGGHSVVWAGDEMIVWGGSRTEDRDPLYNDGAAFDPVSGTWRTIAASPLRPRQFHVAAWTGSEMLIVGGAGRTDGAAYDPATDTWRSIPDLPFRLDPLEPAAVWAGDRLAVASPHLDRVATYTPGSAEWTTLSGTGLDVDHGVLRWDGISLYAVGADSSVFPSPVPLQLARYEAGSWEQLPPVDIPDPGYNIAATPALTGWAGGLLLAWTDVGVSRATVAFDPDTSSWSEIAPTPVPACEARPEPIAIGERLLAFGGCGDDAIYDAATSRWVVVEIDGTGQSRYTVWTGTEVLNWGDTCCYGTSGKPFTIRAWRFTPPVA